MFDAGATVTIRRAETIADYLACQEAQRAAWGITDDSYVVPVATMVGAQLHGGLVLGAFDDLSGAALGVSFAFLGRLGSRLCLYSQLTGVVPGQQGRGLGGRLKQAQRDFAREEGLDCLAWAFDPLQAGNARFNLERLGATARRYVADMYGRRSDALNVGSTTDRLIAEWATHPQPRPDQQLDPAKTPRLIRLTDGPELDPTAIRDAPAVLLEIPGDIASIRKADPALAEHWSRVVGEGFRLAFAQGFVAVGFQDDDATTGPKRPAYLLRRVEP